LTNFRVNVVAIEAKSTAQACVVRIKQHSIDDVVNEFWLLQKPGYGKYKVMPQFRIEEQTLPNTATEERDSFDHVFEEGSSGAFGRALPGEWMSLEEALRVYLRIFGKYWIVRRIWMAIEHRSGAKGT
jgi:hypothetical protein